MSSPIIRINQEDVEEALTDGTILFAPDNNEFVDSSDDEFDECDTETNKKLTNLQFMSESIKNRQQPGSLQKEFIALSLNANRDRTDFEGDQRLEPDLDTNGLPPAYDMTNAKLVQASPPPSFQQAIATDNSKFKEIYESVYKKQTRTGFGRPPKDNSYVIFNANFWFEGASKPYDSSWLRRKAFVMDLENDTIIPGLLGVLLSMKQEEWCEALITDPDLAFGRLGCPPRIPPNSKIFCVVEMIKIVDKDRLDIIKTAPGEAQESGVEFEKFLSVATQARQRGNYYFDRKLYKVALDRYKSGIRILLGIKYKDEYEDREAKKVLLKLFNNSAKTLNALGQPRAALSFCRVAEEIDPKDPKMHYNYIRAWTVKGDYESALSRCYRSVRTVSDPDALRILEKELISLEKKVKQNKKELDDLYTLMSKTFQSNK